LPFLPKTYVLNYLLQQEHFNIIRFIQHLVKYHYVLKADEYTYCYAKKWCLFTRSTGELIHFPNVRALSSVIIDPLKVLPSDSLDYFSISDITTSAACEERILDLKKRGKQIVIILANMQDTTPNQINFLKNCIDKHIDDIISIVISHFPAESVITSQNNYQAIYLNGWDYLYVDSIGFSGATLEVDNVEVDASSWIAWAWGVSTTQISPESVKHGFSKIFLELVNYYSSSIGNIQTGTVTHEFYNLTPKERYLFLEGLFKTHTFLYESMIVKFANLWSGQVLNKLVADVSIAFQKGKVIGSFVSIIQDSMRHLLAPVVADLLRKYFLTITYNLS